MKTLVWFRNDLRLHDNAALYHSAEEAGGVVPVFVWEPDEEAPWAPGAAGRWWLHHSLEALAADLEARGLRLVLRRGPALEVLRALVRSTDAGAVYWNERYAPPLRDRDRAVQRGLRADGVEVRTFPGRLLHDPAAVETTTGGSYHVFTPFWRRLRAELVVPDPLPVPPLAAPAAWPASAALSELGLLAETDRPDGLDASWTPGEAGALRRLDGFADRSLAEYPEARDAPAAGGTSGLSPHLHHGEVSPRQVWQAVQTWRRENEPGEAGAAFLRQLAWREFAYHVLVHHPETPEAPLREQFAAFPWRHDDAMLQTWRDGRTGYPIVDAGMRQLRATGWMHNRVRMIVASFLTKDLRLSWRAGARWFWDNLVDADLANNTMGWQWAAGCGADAQPFFRIFNPVSQGRRHDPDGAYVRRWVPELAGLPDAHVHAPWEAPADVLDAAGVTLGATYPAPVVDHAEARTAALDAYARIRDAGPKEKSVKR